MSACERGFHERLSRSQRQDGARFTTLWSTWSCKEYLYKCSRTLHKTNQEFCPFLALSFLFWSFLWYRLPFHSPSLALFVLLLCIPAHINCLWIQFSYIKLLLSTFQSLTFWKGVFGNLEHPKRKRCFELECAPSYDSAFPSSSSLANTPSLLHLVSVFIVPVSLHLLFGWTLLSSPPLFLLQFLLLLFPTLTKSWILILFSYLLDLQEVLHWHRRQAKQQGAVLKRRSQWVKQDRVSMLK